MGSVFKKSTTRRIPPTAEPFVKNSEQMVRWRVRGKLRTASLSPCGTKIITRSATYFAKFRDADGSLVTRSTRCRDEQTARQKLAQWERRVELKRAGCITANEEATGFHQSVPLPDHFAAFENHQKAKGVNRVYHRNTMSALRRVANDCRFDTLASVTTSPFERWLIERETEGMSARTRNGFREAWIVFANWCIETGRMTANPPGRLPKANTRTDRRKERRALTEAELMQLLEIARTRSLTAKLVKNRGDRQGEANLSPA
ncbi:site-specific integrase [Limnoglobus roseus]|uniref:Integrase n=1 Tax=Limnoglobus roseus TaxID=2598579 RepID=A0A5C1AAK4_9BACT|nr:hypothetical protein [Limnoglobus roseus]QEL16419.1 integrase [Limnoglobus roseus]